MRCIVVKIVTDPGFSLGGANSQSECTTLLCCKFWGWGVNVKFKLTDALLAMP